MNDNMDIKRLWQQQAAQKPDIKKLVQQAKKHRKAELRKWILLNVTMLGTIAFILAIVYIFQPQMLTTKIGIAMACIAIILYMIVSNEVLSLWLKIDSASSNSEYLQRLLQIKAKQRRLQNEFLQAYFILLGGGILLYMIEYASMMPKLMAFLAYGLTIAWILANWFWIRPLVIKKQQDKLDNLIHQYENLVKQLEEE